MKHSIWDRTAKEDAVRFFGAIMVIHIVLVAIALVVW